MVFMEPFKYRKFTVSNLSLLKAYHQYNISLIILHYRQRYYSYPDLLIDINIKRNWGQYRSL